jgi:uncharacterized protein YjaZ
MEGKIFKDYFHKNLSDNPYYKEIMDLMELQQAKVTPAVSAAIEESVSLEDQIQEVDVGDYRISTMTCIYDFSVTLDEYKIYDIAEKMLTQTKKAFEEKTSTFYIEGVECFDKPIVGKQI